MNDLESIERLMSMRRTDMGADFNKNKRLKAVSEDLSVEFATEFLCSGKLEELKNSPPQWRVLIKENEQKLNEVRCNIISHCSKGKSVSDALSLLNNFNLILGFDEDITAELLKKNYLFEGTYSYTSKPRELGYIPYLADIFIKSLENKFKSGWREFFTSCIPERVISEFGSIDIISYAVLKGCGINDIENLLNEGMEVNAIDVFFDACVEMNRMDVLELTKGRGWSFKNLVNDCDGKTYFYKHKWVFDKYPLLAEKNAKNGMNLSLIVVFRCWLIMKT